MMIDGDTEAGVRVERSYASRRLRGLSDRQRKMLGPKVDRGEVIL
jgi:hypothetical protein